MVDAMQCESIEVETSLLQHHDGLRIIGLCLYIISHVELPSRYWLWHPASLVRHCYADLDDLELVDIFSDPLVVGVALELTVPPVSPLVEHSRELCVERNDAILFGFD